MRKRESENYRGPSGAFFVRGDLGLAALVLAATTLRCCRVAALTLTTEALVSEQPEEKKAPVGEHGGSGECSRALSSTKSAALLKVGLFSTKTWPILPRPSSPSTD